MQDPWIVYIFKNIPACITAASKIFMQVKLGSHGCIMDYSTSRVEIMAEIFPVQGR